MDLMTKRPDKTAVCKKGVAALHMLLHLFLFLCITGAGIAPARADSGKTPERLAFLADMEDQYHLPKGYLVRLMEAESRGRAHGVSRSGASGYFGFLPATARRMGITDPHDFYQSAQGAARYVSQLRRKFDGSIENASIAYNWGDGNLERHLRANRGRVVAAKLPAETRRLLKKLGLSATPKLVMPPPRKPQLVSLRSAR